MLGQCTECISVPKSDYIKIFIQTLFHKYSGKESVYPCQNASFNFKYQKMIFNCYLNMIEKLKLYLIASKAI